MTDETPKLMPTQARSAAPREGAPAPPGSSSGSVIPIRAGRGPSGVVLYQHHLASPSALKAALERRGFEVHDAAMFSDVDGWLAFLGPSTILVLELPSVDAHRRAVLDELRRLAPGSPIIALADVVSTGVERDAAETGVARVFAADATPEEVASAAEFARDALSA